MNLIEANAKHAYSHAESLYRAVADAVLQRQVKGGCKDNGCFASVGNLLPVEPDGHTVGWQFTCELEIDMR